MGSDQAVNTGPDQPADTSPAPVAPGHRDAGDLEHTGLRFGLATDLAQVVDAWGLVYTAYRRLGLIDPNPHRIHTTPPAVASRVVVAAGRLGPLTVSTLTVIPDGTKRLPLDSVYGAQLDALRAGGCRLVEVGLFADRREHVSRSATALFELMRFAVYYAAHFASDMMIGVHPHHASFYCRGLGFEPAGPATVYPSVQNKPVVLLRFQVAKNLALNPAPRVLGYILERPVAREVFDQGFDLGGPVAGASIIAQYLRDRARPGAGAAAAIPQDNAA